MDIHTLLMLVAASAVIWMICSPCRQVRDAEEAQTEKKQELSESEVHTPDISLPM